MSTMKDTDNLILCLKQDHKINACKKPNKCNLFEADLLQANNQIVHRMQKLWLAIATGKQSCKC